MTCFSHCSAHWLWETCGEDCPLLATESTCSTCSLSKAVDTADEMDGVSQTVIVHYITYITLSAFKYRCGDYRFYYKFRLRYPAEYRENTFLPPG